MSLLNGLYLLDGTLIECEWDIAENDDGELTEVFTTNLTNEMQFALCKQLVSLMPENVEYDTRIQQAIKLVRNRATWQAAPEFVPPEQRTIH